MAISFVAAASASSLTTTSLAVNVPAGTAAGHVMIAVITIRTGNSVDNAITAPAGWTLVHEAYDPGSPGVRTNVYRRTATASEPASYSWSFASANEPCGSILSYSGVDTTAPIHAQAAGVQATASTTRTTPDITISTADCWVISWFADRSGSDWTGPDTERSEVKVPATSASQVVCDSATAVATGTTSRTATATVSTSVAVQGIIALTPAVSATPVADSDSGTLTDTTTALTASTAVTDSASATDTATLTADATAADSATATDTADLVVMGEPSYRFAIDWNDDGVFGPGEDVTERVLASGGFTASYGRDQARALAPPAVGRAALSLDNSSGDYSPDNTASPLAGDLLPARQVEASVELNGERHVLFRGHLDDYNVKVERNAYTVDATALDPLAYLRGATISTPLYQGIRTGTAIHRLLDAVGWPADKRTIDPGATLIRWWWAHEEDAWDALMKLVGSEGPGAIVHADENGGIVFRDRHHRLLDPRSTTGQAVITDGTDGYEPAFSAITYEHGWKDIVNTVTFSVEERDPATHWEEIWTSDEVYPIAPNDTWTLDIQTSDPIRPGPGAIWLTYAYGGTVTHTVTQNSARSITLTFTAGPSGARLSDLKVHGQTVATRRTYQVEVEDTASIATYGRRTGDTSIDAPWAGVHDALAIAQLLVGARAERLPTVQITIRGARNNTRLVQQVGRDLSDRIHVTETVTGVDTDFFVEQIAHRIEAGGFLETTFGLEKAAIQVENAIRFDDPDHGFDDGVFATDGLDDPVTLFIFDQAGHGFDDGLFAT